MITKVLCGCLAAAVLSAGATAVSAAQPDLVRVAGADRYETAAAISRRFFPSGSQAVYLATGTDFPDALSAGPAAAQDEAPVLLVTRSSLPAATAAELTRLAPSRVVVVGGLQAVGASVVEEVEDLVAGPVSRIAGADRYDTAARVVRAAFPTGVSTLYVASGEAAPDALAAGAAAGAEDGALLLTAGTHLPEPTRDEVERLEPDRIVVVGGTLAISGSVDDQLDDHSPRVVRRGGADRYDTALRIAEAAHPAGVTNLFVATGTSFPDALAASAVAGRDDVPLVLVPNYCHHDVTLRAAAFEPDLITVVGGEAVIGEHAVMWMRSGGGCPVE